MHGVRARWALGVTITAAFAALVVALLVGTATQADNEPTRPHTSSDPTAAPGVELPELRTATSRTYRRPDGSYRVVVSSAPINVRDSAGAWRPVNADLKRTQAGTVETIATPADIALPATLDDPAKLTAGERWVSFALQDASAATPSLSGDTATYRDAMPDVDATYQAHPTGLKETLTLASTDAPSTYHYALQKSVGLSAALRDNGDLVLRDRDGAVRFWLPAPTVRAHGQRQTTEHVSYRLDPDGQGLSVVVDPAWLTKADFPVEVDPTVWIAGADSCTLASGDLATTSDCNGQTLKVGNDSGHTYRSALRFDNASIGVPAIASIIRAELALPFTVQSTANATTDVEAAGLQQTFTDAATWQSPDGTGSWATPGGEIASTPQPNPTSVTPDKVGDWASFDVSALAERWVHDPASNHGVLLRARDENADNVLTFAGQTAVDANPTLIITYTLPTGLRDDQTYRTIDIDDTNKIAVNVASGNIAIDGHDIHLPGTAGLDLDVNRTYNGQNLGNADGVFGSAWMDSINGAAFVSPWWWVDGSRVIYANGGSSYRFDRDYANDTATTRAYTTPPGIDAELAEDINTGESTLTFATGVTWTYGPTPNWYHVMLRRIDDGQGHHIDLDATAADPTKIDTITGSNGDELHFSYDTAGQLTTITGPGSSEWDYTTADNVGHPVLTSVTDDNDHTTTYTYADDIPGTWDSIRKITDANGHDITLEYGADGDYSQITKITQQIDSDRDHDKTWRFDYTPDPGLGHACSASVGGQAVVGRTVITDPDERVETHCYNTVGEIVESHDDGDGTAPVSVSAPTVSGSATEGEMLSASSGVWHGSEPIAYTYQWHRCSTPNATCEDIDGATLDQFMLASSDVGSTVAVVVTATNANGSSSVASAPTAMVEPSAPESDTLPFLDGDAVVGQTLTATDGTWSLGAPLTFARQWRQCDSAGALCRDIAGATGDTYTLTSADLRHTVRLVVTATGPGGNTLADSDPTEVVVAASPSNTNIPSINGSAVDGHTLAADPGVWTASSSIDYSYQWRRCNSQGESCEDIDAASSETYEVTPDDVGSTLRVTVIATADDESSDVSSAPTAVVAGGAPSATSTPTITGVAVDGRELTAIAGQWSGTPPVKHTFRWRACDANGSNCHDINGATRDTYTLSANDVGGTVVVVVTAANSVGSVAVSSDPTAAIAAAAPDNLTVPIISGTAVAGETLAVDSGRWRGTHPSYSYQWRRCDDTGSVCSDITGATERTYVTASADTAHKLRAVVTATNVASASSATSQLSELIAPEATFTAAIAGIASVPAEFEDDGVSGQLRAVPGDVIGDDPITFKYQWQRCNAAGGICVDLPYEWARTYKAEPADLGATLRVVVTATLANGALRTAVSPATATVVVRFAAPDVQVLPAVSGPTTIGSTLTATPGDWPLTTTLAYAWLRCAADGQVCVPIAGADSAAYTVVPADAGRRLRVAVTGTDWHGTATLMSNRSEIVSSSNVINTALPTTSVDAGPNGSVLTATTGAWSRAGIAPITYTYQWLRCDADGRSCARQLGENDSSYQLSHQDIGATIRAVVSASDEKGRGMSRTAATPAVEAIPPAVVGVPTVAGLARVGRILAAESGAWTGIGTLGFSYQWQRCDTTGSACQDIAGATAREYSPQATDADHPLKVVLTARNEEGTSIASSAVTTPVASSVGPVTGPENIMASTITGSAIVGQTLTVHPGMWTGSGPITYAYQWQTCDADQSCVDVRDATDETLTLASSEVGYFIKVVVTATDDDASTIGTAETTQTIALTADLEPTATPVISGSPTEGEVFTVSQGTWTHTSAIDFEVQWQTCVDTPSVCRSIENASQSTYTATADDVDRGLRAIVTANDAEGHRVSAASSVTDAVRATSPHERGAPVITGDTTVGQTLHVVAPAWDGTPPVTSTYQWQRCDDVGDDCQDIVGAFAPDYEVENGDEGATLRVQATGANDDGTAQVDSEATGIVAGQGAPSALALPAVIGTAAEGEVLNASTGSWTTTGAATYDFQWLSCDPDGLRCDRISDAVEDHLELGPDVLFRRIGVAVTARDDAGARTVRSTLTTAVSATVPAAEIALVNTARPTIAGLPRPGVTLVANPGTWTGPEEITYQYRWRACDPDMGECTLIDGAAASTFTPTQDLVGRRIGVLVTATTAEQAKTVAAGVTGVVIAGAPTVISAPWLAWEDTVEGATVTLNPGVWSDADAQITPSWQRCDRYGQSCATIAGADAAQYVLDHDDVDHTVRAAVSATNDLGTTTTTTDPTWVAEEELRNLTAPTLDGTTFVGGLVTLDYGQWTETTHLFEVVWERCDESVVDCDRIGADPSVGSYRPTKADIGHRIRVRLNASNSAGTVSAITQATGTVTLVAEPHNDIRPTVVGDALVGATLTVDDGSWSGAPGTTEYAWLRCDSSGTHCHEIPDAGDATYRVARVDAGARLRGLVTLTNATSSVSARTALTDTVPAAPGISNLTEPAIDSTGGLNVGDSLRAQEGIWAGGPQTITHQWQRCTLNVPATCTDIPGATDLAYYTDADDIGYKIRIKETASDPTAPSVSAYSDPTPTTIWVNILNNPISIAGARAAGQNITAHASVSPAVELPQTASFRFRRWVGGTATVLQEGPNPTYTLTDLDVGAMIDVTATVTVLRRDGVTPVSTREFTAQLYGIAARVTNNVAPAISGGHVAGGLLTATRGTWHSDVGTLAYTYVWQRCSVAGPPCSNIAGATGSSYRSTAQDIGSTVRVRVEARPPGADPSTDAAAAVSALLGPIELGAAPTNTALPIVTGVPAERETLVANPGAWTSSAPITYTYQWRSCDPDFEADTDPDGCTDIDGATDQHYIATSDDLDRVLAVEVTAANASGSTKATSDPTPPVQVGSLPVVKSPPSMTLLGTPDPGSTLITDGGEWEGVSDDELGYQWQRCDLLGAACEPIDDATTESYNLSADDVGHTFSVVVTASNDAGAATANSDISEPIDSAGLMRAAFGATRFTAAMGRIVYYDKNDDTAHASDGGQRLRLVDEDGADPTTVTTCRQLTERTDCRLGHPRISPNFKMIAVENHPEQPSFARVPEGPDGIYVINYDGTRPRFLVEGYDPVWSADGTRIIYTERDQQGSAVARVVRADGRRVSSPRTPLSFDGTFSSTPEEATDGSYVFAGRDQNAASHDLYIQLHGEKRPHRLTLPSRFADVYEPRFTSDESAITFMATLAEDDDAGRHDRLSGWKVELDGSGLTRMTPADNRTYAPGTVNVGHYVTAASSYRCAASDDGKCTATEIQGGTLMVGDADGSNFTSVGVGGLENPVREPSPARDIAVRRASKALRCTWLPVRTKNGEIRQDARHFQAESQSVGFGINMAACAPHVVYRISASLKLTQVKTGHVVMPWTWFSYALSPDRSQNTIAYLSWACSQRPVMDGLNAYRLEMRPDEIPGWGYNSIVGKEVPIEAGAPSQKIVHLRCPRTAERQQAEFNAWVDLGGYNPKTGYLSRSKNLTKVAPRILGQNIGKLKPSPRIAGAWDAHHIIPAHDPAGDLREVQAGAFRCGIYPNDPRNGAWLRNAAFKSDTTGYRRLGAQQRRTWHPVTYYGSLKDNYFAKLRSSILGHGIDRHGSCTSKTLLKRALKGVADDLIDGSYLPKSLETDFD